MEVPKQWLYRINVKLKLFINAIACASPDWLILYHGTTVTLLWSGWCSWIFCCDDDKWHHDHPQYWHSRHNQQILNTFCSSPLSPSDTFKLFVSSFWIKTRIYCRLVVKLVKLNLAGRRKNIKMWPKWKLFKHLDLS